ncbi:MAG: BamA/TamA family outer membrane protein [Rhodobacteraceae bacterium]|nr:BamA/TamA family outer membrane protein [Paracoccaceae bacterium]
MSRAGPVIGRIAALAVLAASFVAGPSAFAQSSSSLPWPVFGKRQAAAAFPYRFTMTTGDLAGTSGDAVRAASQLSVQAAAGAGSGTELLELARGDYRRILSALYAQGYYGAEISIRLNGTEAASVPLTAELVSPVAVSVVVQPGRQFTFGTVAIAPLPPAGGKGTIDLPRPGATAGTDSVRSAAREAVAGWQEQGYALAGIGRQDIVADHATGRLDVDIAIAPGPALTFGAVEVSGAERVDAGFIAEIANLRPGAAYLPVTVDESIRRLRRLGVFRSVRAVKADAAGLDGTLGTLIEVEELPPRRITGGVSLSSSDGIALEGAWIHRNLSGRAERLTLSAAISGIGRAAGAGALDYDLGVEFVKPGVINPSIGFIAEAGATRTVVSTIDTRSFGIEAGLTLVDQIRAARLTAFVSGSTTTDTAGTRSHRLAGLSLQSTYDRRDNAQDARRGWYLDLSLEPFREFSFGNTGFRSGIEARGYWTPNLPGERLTLAARARFGSLAGVPLAESPGDYLFFSGGGGSVRGYGYNSRGVTVGGVFSGGRSVLNLSAEARVRLNERFGLVGFVDAGSVNTGPLPDLGASMHTGAGIGLRYATALGPIRVDLARGLNRVAGDPDFALYIGLGQSF